MAVKKPKAKRSGPTTVSQTSTPNGQPNVHEPVKKDSAASMFWILEYIFLKLLSLFILSSRFTCYFGCRDTPASHRNYPSSSKTIYPHNTSCLQVIMKLIIE